MDGRIQESVAAWARANHQVNQLDQVSEPGIVAILAGKRMFKAQPSGLIEWIHFKAKTISVEEHGSKIALVVGHECCAGHRDSEKAHEADIRRAVEKVYGWGCFNEVHGLFVTFGRNIGEGWKAQKILGLSRIPQLSCAG